MTTQYDLKLTYFDFHGGRGEPARLAMFLGDIPFEDHRVGFKRWPDVKPTTPFGTIPVLEVDGRPVTQSNGINRFVGKLANLYPQDPLQAALADEVMDAVEDITHRLVATFSISNEEDRKAARAKLAEGPLTLYLSRVAALLERAGGQYFADDRLTVADLKVFVWVRHLRSGRLDHIPTDLVGRVAPLLVEHCDRVAGHPKIEAYYESHGGY